MADKRKSFRARRLAFGGRSLPRALIVTAALLAASGALQAQDAGLKNGAASLAAGKYDAAVRQLSATINSDHASTGDAAKALYLRGIAYRKIGESARAVADLGAAIWLGLPADDKVKALVNRGLAYQSAGLSQEGKAQFDAARKLGGSRAVDGLIAEGGGAPAGAAAIAAFSTEVVPGNESASSAGRLRSEPVTGFSTVATGGAPTKPPAPRAADASPEARSTSLDNGSSQSASSSGGNRLTRWFGSLTDSSSNSAAPEPAPAPAPPPKPSPPPAAASSSSWSTSTETQEASSAGGDKSKSRWSHWFGRTAEADASAQPVPAAPATGGGYLLQLATSRSEAEAKALWKQVAQTQRLDGINPQIERVDIGNFGTFYSLRIGPFPDKAESLKVCNALKRSGIDCSPAEQ
jgi:tetratricopeptide (TPR) repeat protein